MRIFLLCQLLCVLAFSSIVRGEPARVLIDLPSEMSDSGFAAHVLPRFQFRARIKLVPATPDQTAVVGFTKARGKGTPVLTARDGTVFSLRFPKGNAAGQKLLKWFLSTPGKNAVASFPKGGPPLFSIYQAPTITEQNHLPEGNALLGSELALRHCGRCHVVDERNRMGGIGSTPSFGALRARDNWQTLFRVFWTEPPHPSFTLIPGMTDAFTSTRPAYISPVQLTLEQVDAIIAFVASIAPKDLGAPLSFN